jgi:O-antigen/teichoic acid export membrane protein
MIQRPSTGHAEWRLRSWAKSSGLFLLLGGMGTIISHTDILMLGTLANSADVGIYKVAKRGGDITLFGLSAINSAIAPRLAKFDQEDEIEDFQKLFNLAAQYAAVYAFIVVTVFILLGQPMVRLVFGEAFAPSYLPLVILSIGHLGASFVGSVGYCLNMQGHEFLATKIMFGGAIANVAANFVLIPLYGATGGAIATGGTSILWNIGLAVALYRRVGIVPTPIGICSQ